MKRNDSLSLWAGLNSNSLKAKPIMPSNFHKLLKLKKELKAYLINMEDEEKELAGAMKGIEISDLSYQEKLKEIQSIEFNPSELYFLSEKEIQWNEDSGAGFALILTEFLLQNS